MCICTCICTCIQHRVQAIIRMLYTSGSVQVRVASLIYCVHQHFACSAHSYIHSCSMQKYEACFMSLGRDEDRGLLFMLRHGLGLDVVFHEELFGEYGEPRKEWWLLPSRAATSLNQNPQAPTLSFRLPTTTTPLLSFRLLEILPDGSMIYEKPMTRLFPRARISVRPVGSIVFQVTHAKWPCSEFDSGLTMVIFCL